MKEKTKGIKEVITGKEVNLTIYEEKEYRKMDHYGLSLEQYHIKQMGMEYNNRLWRLQCAMGRLKKLYVRIESIKSDMFTKEGYKKVKDEKGKYIEWGKW